MRERNSIDDDSNDEPNSEPVEDRRLPPEIGGNLKSLLGTDDRPETFGECIDALAVTFGDDWPPDVTDLCHDDEGHHRAETETDTYRFVCVLDAVLLPFLTDSTVEVRSEGPRTGTTVTSHVSQAGIETDPEDAVLSFGVAPVDPSAEPTPELTYETMCPYIHAFPDRDAYEGWSESVDAPTTPLPLSDGFALARAMVRA
ncbi:organomercurial lyase [Halorussus salinisoli]|uniref:organomercurial lyase n=1 Tax=Halorussus salinisoli TaxID=2558242 RepID=UPI0010C1DF73|nr:organomercurial lyase [Halorussus salinisoli]